jgi:AcrR family transcriptional regulator
MRPRPVAARRGAGHRTRDLILDAAERRFAERGFAAVSMREIAAEVGLKNQASLYNHFENKRALYEAVLARGVDPILAVVAASALPSRGGPVAPDAFLDRTFDYLVEHPYLPRLLQRVTMDDADALHDVVSRRLRPLYASGIRALAVAPGRWPRQDLPHLAAGLYQLIFGYFANAALMGAVVQRDPLSPAALARHRRFLKTAVGQLLGRPMAGRARARRHLDSRVRASAW